jgi:hypothetical protein
MHKYGVGHSEIDFQLSAQIEDVIASYEQTNRLIVSRLTHSFQRLSKGCREPLLPSKSCTRRLLRRASWKPSVNLRRIIYLLEILLSQEWRGKHLLSHARTGTMHRSQYAPTKPYDLSEHDQEFE